MAHVSVAEDVLTSQPHASMQPDLDAPDPDVHTWVIDMWNSELRFLITPAADSPGHEHLEELADGVRRAARRFWLVDEAGEELSAEYPLHDLHTPDTVRGPLRVGSGVAICAGTKDGVTWPLGRAFVAILREELQQLTVDTHISCLPGEIDLDVLTPFDTAVPNPPAKRPSPPEHKFWYINRPVTRNAPNGSRGFDRSFLRPDFSWSPNQADGVSFAKAERTTVLRLVEKLRAALDSEQGEVCALLLPATSENPHPLTDEDIDAVG